MNCYRLTQEIKNPVYDRRTTHGWRQFATIPAGTEFMVKESRYGTPFIYVGGPTGGGVSFNAEGKLEGMLGSGDVDLVRALLAAEKEKMEPTMGLLLADAGTNFGNLGRALAAKGILTKEFMMDVLVSWEEEGERAYRHANNIDSAVRLAFEHGA